MKVGIVGGGQLGRMLLQASANYVVETSVLENDENCPAAHLCHHFTKGDIRNYDDVYNFGKGLDAITIEIESINIEALERLEEEGIKIYPKPAAIRTIKNKITQKQFYKDNEVPTSDFVVTNTISDIEKNLHLLPAVHKLAMGGYDGKGVQVIRNENDINKGFDAPSVLEKMVTIKKEISVIVAVNDQGESTIYPPVEMVFNQDLNLLDYQICPAQLEEKALWRAEAIALRIVKNLQSPGLFAVELFVDINNDVWANETAPRVHNSGHHTIEANFCSQYDMLWRIILNYPLGNTNIIMPSSIVNIVGSGEYTGTALYEGLEEVLKMDNTFVHLYGKTESKPGRKMGHVTMLAAGRQELVHRANQVKHKLIVTGEPAENVVHS